MTHVAPLLTVVLACVLGSTSAEASVRCTWTKVLPNEEAHYSFLRQDSASVRLYHSVWSEERALLGCSWSDDAAVIHNYYSLCRERTQEFSDQPDGDFHVDPTRLDQCVSLPSLEVVGHGEGAGSRPVRSVDGLPATDSRGQDEKSEVQIHQRVKRGFIVPGTLWCGSGNKAPSYGDLGVFADTDSCCREHDQCKHTILSFHSEFGVFNTNIFTMSHCECDHRFRRCLMDANDSISHAVGYTFFNLLKMHCFEFSHRLQCTQRNWFGLCKESKMALYAEVHPPTLFDSTSPTNDSANGTTLNTTTEHTPLLVSTTAPTPSNTSSYPTSASPGPSPPPSAPISTETSTGPSPPPSAPISTETSTGPSPPPSAPISTETSTGPSPPPSTSTRSIPPTSTGPSPPPSAPISTETSTGPSPPPSAPISTETSTGPSPPPFAPISTETSTGPSPPPSASTRSIPPTSTGPSPPTSASITTVTNATTSTIDSTSGPTGNERTDNAEILSPTKTQSVTEQDSGLAGRLSACGVYKDLDKCRNKIPPGESRFGLDNSEARTVYHCDCTSRLFQTLSEQTRLSTVQVLLLDRVSQSCFLLQDCTAGNTCTAALVRAEFPLVEVEDQRHLQAVRLRVRPKPSRAKRKGRAVTLHKLCLRMSRRKTKTGAESGIGDGRKPV